MVYDSRLTEVERILQFNNTNFVPYNESRLANAANDSIKVYRALEIIKVSSSGTNWSQRNVLLGSINLRYSSQNDVITRFLPLSK